ncbi:hypothetical protein BJY01DRAFT_252677 [Aspergillus pseudoustus]|uniref:Uncharacterized protein n=1 Tax=Aspergillus pseudoustus TaxID=1810923 RepID=A0ABR4J5X0_9EURO
MDLYAWLNLTAEEEDSLVKWDLLPYKRSDDSLRENEVSAKKALIHERRPDIRVIKRIVVRAVEGVPDGKVEHICDTKDWQDIFPVGYRSSRASATPEANQCFDDEWRGDPSHNKLH